MRIKILLIILLVATNYLQPVYSQGIKINEVMSSNHQTIVDEDGNFSDWIELKNTGTNPVNLLNYSLSDDLDTPQKWLFPDFVLEGHGTVVVFASGKDKTTVPTHWETVINKGDTWKFIIPVSNIPGWSEFDFDDTSWDAGITGIGYGDEDDATVIEPSGSVFLRKEFTIDNPAQIIEMILSMDYDDGFVAYLNGVEIARANLGTEGVPVNYNTYATVDHESSLYLGESPEKFTINNFSQIIKTGKNILAVQVHNNYSESSDLSATPFLSIRKLPIPETDSPSYLELAETNFHLNFKLDAEGDSILLFNASRQKIDELIFENYPSDVSFGYKPDNYSEKYVFAEPTPWRENTTEALHYDETILPEFSQSGGIFDTPVDLSISATDMTSSVYYSIDGSEPDINSPQATTPITINEPTTIRARVIKPGYYPGKIVTQSYFPSFNKSLPVLFLSTDPGNLWDEESGIYVKGTHASTKFPYFGANFWQDWEKPAHVELYFPSGQDGFNIDAGVKIFGNYTRGYTQKSLAIFAREKYGDKSIKCKLFENKPIDKFESIILRSGGTDNLGENQSWGTLIRDQFIANLGNQINLDAQAGRPCVVYLNGVYWGIHNIREKVNEHFLADNNNVSENNINLLEFDSEPIVGSYEHYAQMMSFINENDITVDENYQYVQSKMDIDNYIRYNVLELFSYNDDWPGNNIKYWRTNSDESKWRWILFDVDTGFGLWDPGSVNTNSIAIALEPNGPTWPNPPWSTFLFRSLIKSETFKNRFLNTFADHLNSTLLPQKVKPLVESYANMIDDEIEAHTEKWGSSYETWLHNVGDIYSFADKRPSIIRKIILQQFSVADTQQVHLQITGCDIASIQVNTIKVDQFPWDGIYFNQIPIELTALAPLGYKFSRWEGDVDSTNPKIQVSMDTDVNITAVFEVDNNAKTIVINEISYNPSDEFDSGDWVELYNNSSNYINLTNWILKDSDDANEYKIQANTVLEPNGYLIICRNTSDFASIYPDIKNYQGPMGFGFSSAGECIRLYDDNKALVNSVCFASEYPWPTGPNGNGYTLSLNDPDQDNDVAQNWFTSRDLKGSPGAPNIITAIEELSEQTDQSYLLQNYPNPFNSSTFIPIYSGENQQVNLSIYSLQGQIVTTIFDGELKKGYHTFEWNVSGINEGMYIIRMSGPKHNSFKKAIFQNN